MKTVTVRLTDAPFEIIDKRSKLFRATHGEVLQALAMGCLEIDQEDVCASMVAMLYNFGACGRIPDLEYEKIVDYDFGVAPSAAEEVSRASRS
jgi:hypothetical protein